MAYKLLYGGQYLHDPYTGESVTDASLTAQTNNADYMDFTIHYGHSLYDVVAENASIVELYWDKTKLFEGVIESIETDIEGSKSISCKGGLSYLEDTIVRAYSTVEGEQPVTAPSSPAGLFQWYIDQHNRFCDSKKRFNVGENQANMLDSNAYIYRSSSQNPTTWSEISSKLIDELGGYVEVQYTEPRTISYYADVHSTNAQIIDFGVNITDFSKTVDTAEQYTAVYAQGATPDAEGDETTYPIDLTSLPDGTTSYSSDFFKDGDHVYSVSGVARYGYREYAYSNTDCTTAEGLLESACKALSNLLSPDLSITVKAVDLALYMDGYDHLRAGQAVRVRSKFHDVDEYLMVSSISLDLNDPSQTTYELGASYQTLTGQQSTYLKNLNANTNKALDTATALSAETKAAAQEAKDAREQAATATATAETASSDAIAAKEAASKAVVSTTTEYATNQDPATAPTEGWSADQPEWTAGNYIWMRQTVTYGDASTETTEPACITGNQGEQGAAGEKGDKGEQGIQGEKGETGATGAKGDKGDTGATGAKGDKGDTGATGAKGEDGASFAWNMLYGTATPGTMTGAAKSDQCAYFYTYSADGKAKYSDVFKPGVAYTHTMTVTVEDDSSATSLGVLNVQHNAVPWRSETGGLAWKTVTRGTTQYTWTVTGYPSSSATAIGLRLDNVPTTTKITVKDWICTQGTTASPWCTAQSETIGADGVSPTVTTKQTDTGATITITDATGTKTATVTNGQDADIEAAEAATTAANSAATSATTAAGKANTAATTASSAASSANTAATSASDAASKATTATTNANAATTKANTAATNADTATTKANNAAAAASKVNATVSGTTLTVTDNTGKSTSVDTKGEQGTDGASVTSVKMEYTQGDSSTTAPTTGWQDAVPEWETGHYIWQRSVTTITAADGTATTQTGDAVLYGAFNSLATDVAGNATAIQQNATAIQQKASTADVSSAITQMGDSVTAKLTEYAKSETVEGISTKTAWLNVTGAGGTPSLELGSSESDYKLQLTNEALNFKQDDVTVASITNQKMTITSADIHDAEVDQLSIEPYQLVVRNGHFLIQYVGE